MTVFCTKFTLQFTFRHKEAAEAEAETGKNGREKITAPLDTWGDF